MDEDCAACAVCLDTSDSPQLARIVLGCSHAFHAACVEPWLLLHTTCPVCRRCSVESGCIMLTSDASVLSRMQTWKPVTRLAPAPPPDHQQEVEPPALGGWVLNTSLEMTAAMIWMGGLQTLVLRPMHLPHAPHPGCPVLCVEERQPKVLETWVTGAFTQHQPPFGNFWISE